MLSKIKRFKYSYFKEYAKEVISLITKTAYRITGLVVLLVGALFFLRDLGVNYIGNTSGWTILIVLSGAGLLAGDMRLNEAIMESKKSKR